VHVISTFTRAAVREVFATMLNLEVESMEHEKDDVAPPLELSGVSGGVSFTGKMTGILYLNMSEFISRLAADRILGDDPNRPADEINDVVGELTNMVTGNLKSKMADRGYNCALSIPTVIRGLKVSIDSVQPSVALINSFKVPDTTDKLNVCIFARLEE
jgi:CheY-specific phosphatase CheX